MGRILDTDLPVAGDSLNPDLDRLKREIESPRIESERIIQRMTLLNDELRAIQNERRRRGSPCSTQFETTSYSRLENPFN
jgi:hypothetical protein